MHRNIHSVLCCYSREGRVCDDQVSNARRRPFLHKNSKHGFLILGFFLTAFLMCLSCQSAMTSLNLKQKKNLYYVKLSATSNLSFLGFFDDMEKKSPSLKKKIIIR